MPDPDACTTISDAMLDDQTARHELQRLSCLEWRQCCCVLTSIKGCQCC